MYVFHFKTIQNSWKNLYIDYMPSKKDKVIVGWRKVHNLELYSGD